ncbi:hypothetical protein BKA70DRAFT_1421466 [Coprinopsis sp. MPI-PUGE-AT-0042]|nr:hypothetical protein BKA70DRAFT_1421466 [Coprinopsis sp. MPI-PUGE-AT-0042]
MFEGQYDQDQDDEDEEADRERGQGHEGDTEGDEPSENRHLAPPLFQNRQPTSPLPEPSPRRPRPPSLARASPRPFASFGSRSASLPTSRRLRSPPPPPLTHDQDDEDEAEDTDEPLVRSLSFQPKVPDRASKTAPASSSAATSALRSVKPLPTSRIPFPLTNQSAPGSASNTASVSVPVPPRRPTSSTSSLADKAQSKIPVPTRTRKVSGTPHPIKSRRNNQTSGEREESSKNISTSMPRSSSSHLSLRGTSRGNDLVGNASKENAKPVNKRRLTLDEELRNALPLPLSKEDLEDIEDADVYSGLGSMEPRGFFAHGGAGGLGVWIGPGHEVTERLSR